MATNGKDSSGRKRILFVGSGGKRQTLRLGKCSKRDAEQVRRHVEDVPVAKINGQPLRRVTAVWSKSIGDKLHRRLSRVGLVEARAKLDGAKLGPSLTDYLDSRADLKPATKIVRRLVVNDSNEYFGEARDIR
ncbi:MAG: hypothetical protein HY287_13430 [Planctomycetes bacterium]|nr:hypothetical protein [Planctomycetota bacterium]MBI3835324.1 hypothetical protein [Planctomycetota bacterium]